MSDATVPTIQILDRQWDRLSVAPALRARIRAWHQAIPTIPNVEPNQLVAAAATRNPEVEGCPTLDALVALAHSDDMALQVIMRAMLPRWMSIMASTPRRGRLSADEMAAIVVSIGTETILRCDVDAATTPTDYRLWSDTRHRVHRHLARHYPTIEAPTSPELLADVAPPSWQPDHRTVEDLAAWIMQRADVSRATARLVAVTRTGHASLEEAAAAAGLSYAAAAKRRARTERRLRRKLTPA